MIKGKQYIGILCIGLNIITSCSKNNDWPETIDNDNRPTEQTTQPEYQPSFTLVQDNANTEILSLVEYKIGGQYRLNDIAQYDSIIWHVEGLEGKHHIIKKNTKDSIIVEWGWSHCFYLPGKYNTHLDFYQDNKQVKRYSTKIDVKANKDFLDTNWKDMKSTVVIGYINLLDAGYTAGIYHYANNQDKYVKVSYLTHRERSDKQKSDDKERLKKWMRQLYGEPLSYADQSDEIRKRFVSDFKYKDKDAIISVHALWITGQTRMALVHINNEDSDYYAVIGEPKETINL